MFRNSVVPEVSRDREGRRESSVRSRRPRTGSAGDSRRRGRTEGKDPRQDPDEGGTGTECLGGDGPQHRGLGPRAQVYSRTVYPVVVDCEERTWSTTSRE